MARDFARAFYNSSAWKKCQHAYFISQHGLCERCGNAGKIVHHQIYLTPENINDPDIALNWDHLELLCQDCHNKEHNRSNETATRNGYTFDADGNLVSINESKYKTNVYIVWGSPASGKTTYVSKYKSKGDLVVDLDLIMDSISMNGKSKDNDKLLPVALGVREYLYNIVEKREIDCENVWVVATLSRRYEREQLRDRLNAELIYIEATRDECIARAYKDDDRHDKELQKKIIDKWFSEYERD
jgi:predicted kinase